MKSICFFLLSVFCVVAHFNLKAQYCSNNVDTVYGLASITGTNSGQIIGININNGGTTLIGSPASGSANANGVGYCSVDGCFYFFNQAGAGATEFVRFNPVTGTKVSLSIPSSPALPTATAGKIRSGTMNSAGTGYYFIFPGATMAMGYPKTGAALYYYSIGTNTWTLITQTFVDNTATAVTDITSLNSGDMTFDGDGNLWMLSSNTSNYALYKINAPLPITPVASITVNIKIPKTAIPGGSVSFTGIAFNSIGSLYLSTGSYTSPPGNAFHNKLYEMSTVTSSLTVIGTLPNGYGDDLTSCTFPHSVLASSFMKFEAKPLDGKTQLIWESGEGEDVKGYWVEYGTDSKQLKPIYFIPKKNAGVNETAAYNFLHEDIHDGIHYYRIRKIADNSQPFNSDIKRVVIGNTHDVYIGPNPANDYLLVNNINCTVRYIAKIYDNTGKFKYSKIIDHLNRSVNIGDLNSGLYILYLVPVDSSSNAQSFKFVKR